MSVTSNLPYDRFDGNGSTTSFEFESKVDSSSELRVAYILKSTGAKVADWTYDTEYTATGFGTGTITVTPATTLPSTHSILIYTVPDLTQENDYEDLDQFPADQFESDLDKGIKIDQYLQRLSDQAPKVGVEELGNGVDLTLPALAARKGKALSFNATTGAFETIEPSTVAASDAASVSYNQGGTGAVDTTVKTKLQETVSVKDFGAVGDGVTNDTAAVLAAVAAARGTSTSISTDGLGSGSLTIYPSREILFPPGVYKVDPDSLAFTQDFGIKFKGAGSRGTSNYIKGATTILISGTSSGFGIQVKGNGARMFCMEDLDLCYETSAFTGNLLDIYSAPGVYIRRCYLGTYGTSGGTRLQSANSLVRLTYDEFVHLQDTTLDGAVDGVWSDDTREPSPAFSAFGGFGLLLTNVTFYDFTGDMVRNDGNRTRQGLRMVGCSFNPISIDCDRCLDLNNVEGLYLSGTFTPSVANKATTEWIRALACTGVIETCTFDDLSAAGTISGQLNVLSNRFFSTNGLTLKGGIINSKANEFSTGTYGFLLDGSPDSHLTLDLGPDVFKAALTRSYDVSADSSGYSGRISYDSDNDASSSGFRNTSTRISVENVDIKNIVVTDASYTVLSSESGRTVVANGGAAQTFTLPTPVPGTRHRIIKISNQNLTINCAASSNFYGHGTAYTTSAALTGTAMGSIDLIAYDTAGWLVESIQGSWSLT